MTTRKLATPGVTRLKDRLSLGAPQGVTDPLGSCQFPRLALGYHCGTQQDQDDKMSLERIPTNKGNIPLRRWWKKVGPEVVKLVCDTARISYAHFKHVAAGRRRMSPETAAIFVKAAGGGLSFRQLMPPRAAPAKPKA